MCKRTMVIFLGTIFLSRQTTPLLHRPLRGCYSGRDVTPRMEDSIHYIAHFTLHILIEYLCQLADHPTALVNLS